MRLQSLPTLFLFLTVSSLAVFPPVLQPQSSCRAGDEPADSPACSIAANNSAPHGDLPSMTSNATPASPGSGKAASASQLQASIKSLAELRERYRAAGNRTAEAHAIGAIASSYNAMHQDQKAIETYQSALGIWRELGNKTGEGTTLAHIGDVYREWGFPEQAIRFYRDALKAYPSTSDRPLIASVRNNLGLAYFSVHDKKNCLTNLEQALADYRARHDLHGEAVTLVNLGSTYGFLANDPHKAVNYFQEALTKLEVLNDRSTEAGALELLGGVWIKLQKPDIAANTFKRSLFLFSRLGNAQGEASVRKQLRIMGESPDQASIPDRYSQ